VFRPWAGRLAGVEICPVQPPGRETRRTDPPHTSMTTLVAELADVVLHDAADAPYALYGHSLGALTGFELAKEIRGRGAPPPAHLLVSGCSAPHWVTDDDRRYAGQVMTDDQIVALLRSLGGTPEPYLSDPTALRIILPPLRADLAVKTTYRYQPGPPLDIPVTAIAGTSDARATVESMLAWREQTVARFRSRVLTGGHFAVLEQPDSTLYYIREALRPWL
jgi:surfactin synthase thioesterase subunit